MYFLTKGLDLNKVYDALSKHNIRNSWSNREDFFKYSKEFKSISYGENGFNRWYYYPKKSEKVTFNQFLSKLNKTIWI